MATNLLLPNVTQSGLQQNAVRLAVVLYGAWLALTRAQFSGRARLTAWLAIAVLLLVWQSVVWWLALARAFQGRIGPAPLLPLAIVLPLLIGLPILLNSNTIGQWLRIGGPDEAFLGFATWRGGRATGRLRAGPTWTMLPPLQLARGAAAEPFSRPQ